MARLTLVGPVAPYRGGIAHFTEALAQALQARGHQVRALSFRRQYPRWLFPGRQQTEPEPTTASMPAAYVLDPLHPWTWRQAVRTLQQQQPDLVVFQYWLPFFAPAYGVIARWLRRKGIRAVALVHNALPHERHVLDAALSRWFLRQCRARIVLSTAVAQQLAALGVPAEVRLVHPIDPRYGPGRPRKEARQRLGLPVEAPVLLFFGFVRRYKGLDVLLEAMPSIRAALPDVQLIVAGEFYERPEYYQERIRALGLTSCVHVHDHYIPESSVVWYFSAADLVVQPYLAATQSGVVPLAFHFERPVVVTAVGGLPEVVPHEIAGFVVPPDDVNALAEAVVRFFQEGWAERLTQGVRRLRTRFGWDPLCETLEQMLPEGCATIRSKID
ncbi:glycosyltransferase [Rhodothermus profundi]|uniref:Glycosyltransferase involved in cell wall bisynthesis n=1 Tax=Rhodothermus profundi TaxID=633813 RepID=A0A1M6RER2_9BACT|nr:glycosyltransferase [Rhodothermus profundi]SHK30886.1 Glycosyltransferase involved in cell wall bisynthesis [Rhodothermus profundi]